MESILKDCVEVWLGPYSTVFITKLPSGRFRLLTITRNQDISTYQTFETIKAARRRARFTSGYVSVKRIRRFTERAKQRIRENL
jgi:hypothetical protein